ncbi:MAG: response regulator transcription factor [bacterium]|nr:response regulator transcription factor [bacterium]
MIRLAITEDNPFLAKSIQQKLEHFPNDFQLKMVARNGNEILEQLEGMRTIDVILMDIEMPEKNGIDATQIIKQKYPQIKVLMLTVFDDEENVFNAILAGANGYLLKDEPADKLYNAIHEVMSEGAPMSPLIASKALKLLRNPTAVKSKKEEHNLTKREVEVLQQLSTGLDYNQISENLFISPATVRKHIENIYSKLHAHNKMEAVQAGRDKGIL